MNTFLKSQVFTLGGPPSFGVRDSMCLLLLLGGLLGALVLLNWKEKREGRKGKRQKVMVGAR